MKVSNFFFKGVLDLGKTRKKEKDFYGNTKEEKKKSVIVSSKNTSTILWFLSSFFLFEFLNTWITFFLRQKTKNVIKKWNEKSIEEKKREKNVLSSL